MTDDSLFDGVNQDGYNAIWKLWKAGSIGLFAVFVFVIARIGATLKRIESKL